MGMVVTGLTISLLLLNLLVNQADTVQADANKPGIVGDIPDVTKNLGETASLDCRVKNKGSLKLYWNQLDFDQPVLIAVDEEIKLNNPVYADNTTKYHVSKTFNADQTVTYRLTIQRLEDIDAGRYNCSLVLDGTDSSKWPTAGGVINIRGVCHTCSRIVGEIGPETGRVNSSGSMSCVVSNKGTNVVHWKKDTGGIEISSEGNIVAINPEVDGQPKYEIAIESVSSGSRYRLKINRLSVTDSGTYRCYIVGGGNAFKTGEFTTQVPPTVTSSASSFEKREGEFVTMTCTATGLPTPSIDWTRADGRPLPGGSPIHQGPSLTIQNITREQRGYYKCIASNGVPSDAETVTLLYVRFNPTARAVIAEVKQAIGYQAELACIIEGYPDASSSWYSLTNGKVAIVPGGRYSISNRTSGGIYINRVTSVLKIDDLVEADFGDYSCEGRNPSGVTGSATIKLSKSDYCMGSGCPYTRDTAPPGTTPTGRPCTGSHCADVSVKNQRPLSVTATIAALICVTMLSNGYSS